MHVDWRRAPLSPREREMCAYAEKLTRTPAAVEESDIERLRRVGLDDVAIVDLVHVIGFFAYANRIADGLGIELDPEMRGPSP